MLEDYYAIDRSELPVRKPGDLYYAKWGNIIEPIDLNEAVELDADQMGFVLIGFKCDKGVYINHGRAGALEGPEAIRNRLKRLPWHLGSRVRIFDAGDIEGVNRSLSDLQESLSVAVERIVSLGLFPIVLGGGHETTFGHYMGHLKTLPTPLETIGALNIDAHFDLREYDKTGPNSGTGFRQLYDLNQEKGLPFYYLVLGIQEHANQMHLFDYVAKHDTMRFLTGREIYTRGLPYVYQQVDRFIEKVDHVYLTIDMDCFSMGVAPGVSAIQPIGLDPQGVVAILQYIASKNKLLGFDIVEVSPAYDVDYHTSTLAATLIFYLTQVIYQTKQKYKEI